MTWHTSDSEKSLLASVPTGLFIGGAWRDAAGGATLDVEDPATGEVLTAVADADASPTAGRRWTPRWPPRPAGRPRRPARPGRDPAGGVRGGDRAGGGLRPADDPGDGQAAGRVPRRGRPTARSSSAGSPRRRCGSRGRWSTAPNGATRLMTMKQPVGPTLMITPWNFPLAMGTRKIGPAIAAGCTMVVKPAAQTPLTMLALAAGARRVRAARRRAQRRHHLARPATVMEPLIRDPRLRKLTFTGSTPVGQGAGRAVGRAAAAGVDGARRQRPVPRLRGRRPRPGRRRARCWPRCATSARPAPRPTGSSCTSPSPTEFSQRVRRADGAS